MSFASAVSHASPLWAEQVGWPDEKWALISRTDHLVLGSPSRVAKVAFREGGEQRLAHGARMSRFAFESGVNALPPINSGFEGPQGFTTVWPRVRGNCTRTAADLTNADAHRTAKAFSGVTLVSTDAITDLPSSSVADRIEERLKQIVPKTPM
jgi:hypothetical protein